MSQRQRTWERANSHLVTFRIGASYRARGERLMIPSGTRLVGMLIDGPEPALHVPSMTIALSPQMVEIVPNPDPQLTLRALAQQTEQAGNDALASGDADEAANRFREATVQYRLLDDTAAADGMKLAAQRAHNQSLRTPESIASYDQHTGVLSDEALRQLGATLRAALRQLGGYQYRPATFAEALAVWDVVRGAVAQIGNFDHGYRQRPRAAEPISPETMWLSPEYLAGELLTEPEGSPDTIAARAEIALALDPDEADSYTLLGGLAEQRGDWDAARRWYEAGVKAGERKLGSEYFTDPNRPRFWLAVETRPYMRARAALAGLLYQRGAPEQAIAEYWGLLELNPGDNQGIRYMLASLLLEQRDHAQFERLHRFMAAVGADDEDDDDEGDGGQAMRIEREPSGDPLDPAALNVYEGAYWLYPAALYRFQREGDSERARAVLELAHRQNRFVVPLLTSQRRLPAEGPPSYSHGGEDEAVVYALLGRAAWAKTPGAIEWLRGKPAAKATPKTAVPRSKPASTARTKGEGAALRDLLNAWVRDDSTYQVNQTKKIYRTTIARLLSWLEQQGELGSADALTAERIEAFLVTAEPTRRGQARNSIAVWCDWLVERKELARNPIVRGTR